MNRFGFIVRKVVTAFLAVVIAVTAVYAPLTSSSVPRAHAALGVLDTNVTDILEFALNGLAWAVAKATVNAITQSTVNWINSGFQGSPAFATDLNRNLRQLGDATAARLIGELINNSTITSPYLQQITGSIAAGYLLYTSRDRLASRLEYTLERYATNPQNWLRGDFNRGGFNAWMAMTWTCGNDPACAQFTAQEELINRLDSQLQQRLSELSYGRGFLSWKNCPDYRTEEEGGDGDGVDTTFGGASLSDEDRMAGCTISTPGSVIESQLEHQLGSGIRQLEIADSINEIVGALAAQLVKQALGGGGLLGTSNPSGGDNGGRSYLEQASNESSEQTTAALSEGFRENVERDRTRITTLLTAATAANTVCQQAGSDAEQASQIATIVTNLTSAGTEIDTILARITAAQSLTGAQQNAAAASITNDYSRLLASGRIPTASDVGTDPGVVPLSPLLRLRATAENGCD